MIINKIIFIFRHYGFFSFLKLVFDFIITKIFFRKCRLIRFPFYIRGRKYIKIGLNFTSGVNARIDSFNFFNKNNPKIIIGNNVQINDSVHIAAVYSIIIGDNVLIASRVFICDHNHGIYSSLLNDSNPDIPPIDRYIDYSPVVIGNNVWVGEQVSILSGVKIGDGSVIGANSVVTKDIPSYSIAVGNPAKVIKFFDFNMSVWRNL